MAFFEDLGKKLTQVGEAAAEKTKDVAEFTKAKAKVLDVSGKLDKAYIAMAKKYLELHPANEEEGMKQVVDAVYALEDQLKELERQLQDLKGVKKCESCGAECETDAAFCSACGAELKKKEVIIEGEASEVEETVEEDDIEENVE